MALLAESASRENISHIIIQLPENLQGAKYRTADATRRQIHSHPISAATRVIKPLGLMRLRTGTFDYMPEPHLFNHGMNAISETEKKYGRYCYKIAKNIFHIDEDAKEGEARLSLALSAFGLRRPVLW